MAVKTISILGKFIGKEYDAAAAITPGDLLELASATTVQKHSTANANAAKMFARENDIFGKNIDDDYAANDVVLCGLYERGAEVYARVAAGTAAITVGAALASAGDGTVQPVTASAATTEAQRDGIVGYALEAVDNSGGGSAVRIRMEVA